MAANHTVQFAGLIAAASPREVYAMLMKRIFGVYMAGFLYGIRSWIRSNPETTRELIRTYAQWIFVVGVLLAVAIFIEDSRPLFVGIGVWAISMAALVAVINLLRSPARKLWKQVLPYLERIPTWLWPVAILILLVLSLYWLFDESSLGFGKFLAYGSMALALFLAPIFLWLLGKDYLTWRKSTPAEREIRKMDKKRFAARRKFKQEFQGITGWLWRIVIVMGFVVFLYWMAGTS